MDSASHYGFALASLPSCGCGKCNASSGLLNDRPHLRCTLPWASAMGKRSLDLPTSVSFGGGGGFTTVGSQHPSPDDTIPTEMFTRQIRQNLKSVTVKITNAQKIHLICKSVIPTGALALFSRHKGTLVGKFARITDPKFRGI